mmetsp:Transcript_20371/g.45928  ORF Transcript_20371/g.45928 Transcript_20371/m.45928 type:complete len:88 (+) Transcript_20371:2-265(+)
MHITRGMPARPLDIAAISGHLAIAKLLVQEKSARELNFWKPVKSLPAPKDLARQEGHEDLADFLVKKEKEMRSRRKDAGATRGKDEL